MPEETNPIAENQKHNVLSEVKNVTEMLTRPWANTIERLLGAVNTISSKSRNFQSDADYIKKRAASILRLTQDAAESIALDNARLGIVANINPAILQYFLNISAGCGQRFEEDPPLAIQLRDIQVYENDVEYAKSINALLVKLGFIGEDQNMSSIRWQDLRGDMTMGAAHLHLKGKLKRDQVYWSSERNDNGLRLIISYPRDSGKIGRDGYRYYIAIDPEMPS